MVPAQAGGSDVKRNVEDYMSSVKLSTKLEFDRVSFEKEHTVHLLINLEGKKSDPQNRKPLMLSAVIDISGSMSGQKIEYAKKTLKKLIANLTSEDRLGIVAYSTQVWTVFPAGKMTSEAKEKASAEVDKLHSMDSTNLSGGMLEGFGMLKDAEKDNLVRVFMMTDGLPNVGIADHPGIINLVGQRPSGMSLSCFGYGSDYNPELLESMAKTGGGNLHHIKNPDDCMGAFGRELGGLITCIAQGIKVKVKTKPDFKILEVLSDFDVVGNKDETEAVVSVDDVYSEERRRILLKIQIPKTGKALPRPIKFADIEVTFQDLVANEPREEKASVEIEQVKPEDAQKDAAVEVKEEIARIAAGKAQEEAIKLANAGNFAGARQVVMDAAVFCMAVGTDTADAYAADLKNEVIGMVQPAAYAAGGMQALVSNKAAYMKARSTSKGTSPMFSSKAVQDTEAKFGEDDPNPQGPVPFLQNGPIKPSVASNIVEPKKTLTKGRAKRE